MSRKMQRRTRDTCWCLVRGKVKHVNDLHDRCAEIVFDHAPGEEDTWGEWPETNPQRRRRILEENRKEKPPAWMRPDTHEELESVRRGMEDWKAGRLVPWYEIKAKRARGFKARNARRSARV